MSDRMPIALAPEPTLGEAGEQVGWLRQGGLVRYLAGVDVEKLGRGYED